MRGDYRAGEGQGGDARPLPRWRGVALLVVIAVGSSAGPLDTAVNIAFPDMTASFGNGLPAIQWVIICNVLTYACLIPALGRLADIVGHRRVFLIGLAWSAVAHALCALAPTFEWFLVARVLQGAGIAFLLSTGAALATLSFPERERPRVLGWFTLGFAAALMVGPIIGGPLVDLWGWPAVFWFRVPLMLVALVATLAFVPETRHTTRDESYDFAGALGLGVVLGAVLLALNQGYRLGGLGFALVTAFAFALVVWFVRHERRVPHPVLDVELFRRAPFAGVNLAHVLMNTASFTILLLVPYYLIRVFGANTTYAGLLLALAPLGMMAASPVAGHLLRRGVSPLPLGHAGLVVLAIALALIAVWPERASVALLAGTLFAQGIGQGLYQVASIEYVMGSLPRTRQGVAGSLNMVTRTMGVVISASTASFVFTLLSGDAGSGTMTEVGAEAFLAGHRGAFLAAAAAALLGNLALLVTRPARA